MKAQACLILVILVLTALLACGNSSDEALNVAKNFWSAMEERDIEKARTFATEETAGSVTINEDAEEQETDINFGEITFEDGAAMVATTIAAKGDDSQMEMEMQTVLVKENGTWKVDVDRTFMSMFGGAMGAMMDQMGEAMQKGMEEMGKAMVDAMEEATEDDD
jgi:hypothetical protein